MKEGSDEKKNFSIQVLRDHLQNGRSIVFGMLG